MKLTYQQIIAYIAGVLGVGVVAFTLFTGSTDPITQLPSSITVEGETINFTWTDDNAGEDLLIYTDKDTYTNGVSSATVFVAIVNNSGTTQNVELQGFFESEKQRINNVDVLVNVTTEEPIFSEVCKKQRATSTNGTVNVCSEEEVGTSQKTEPRWVNLPLSDRGTLEISDENVLLSTNNKARKSVDNYISNRKTNAFPMADAEVVYYRLNVVYPTNSNGNFFLEAIGDKGGYGHLDPWFDASWDYRVSITVDDAKVPSTQSSFPVYVDLSDMPASFFTNAKSDGCDIRVVESDETTETAFELVSYDAGGTGELHFMADSLTGSGGGDTTFYIYYGNSGASCYATTATYGAENVWVNYDLVMHGEDALTDSTGNFSPVQNGTVVYNTGNLGKGFDIPGTGSNYPQVPDTTGSAMDYTGDHVFTFWGKNDAASGRRSPFSKGSWTVSTGYWLHFDTSANSWQMSDPGNSYSAVPNLSTVDIGTTMTHIVYRKVSATSMQMFFDGTASTLCTVSVDAKCDDAYTTNNNSLYIGRRTDYPDAWDGIMDEVRMTDAVSVVTADYITTEYNNQSDTSTFYTVGTEETNGGGSSPQTPQSVFFFGLIKLEDLAIL